MITDSINDEILRIKRDLAKQFDNDLDRIIADTKSREKNTITLPPRKYRPESNTAVTLPTTAVAEETAPRRVNQVK